jgi:hypothetical protein
MTATELVEWKVGKLEENGTITFTRDGAQSVFGQTRAEKLAKKRGPGWSLYHHRTDLSPEAQATFEAEHKDQSPRFGGQWGE